MCGVCGARYSNRRWVPANAPMSKTGKHKHWRPTSIVTCPGCKKQQEGVPAGFVYLSGAFLQAHHEEIEHLLDKEAERAAVDNPLARIMGRTTDEKAQLVITTTAEHLAERDLHLG